MTWDEKQDIQPVQMRFEARVMICVEYCSCEAALYGRKGALHCRRLMRLGWRK